MKRTLALALALAAGVALAQSVKWTADSGAIPFDCTGTACDLAFDTPASPGFSCYVANGSDAARNVTVTLYRDDGNTTAFISGALSCSATTKCLVTVHPAATVAPANALVLPVVPTRRATLTVAAGGTSGSATIACIGR